MSRRGRAKRYMENTSQNEQGFVINKPEELDEYYFIQVKTSDKKEGILPFAPTFSLDRQPLLKRIIFAITNRTSLRSPKRLTLNMRLLISSEGSTWQESFMELVYSPNEKSFLIYDNPADANEAAMTLYEQQNKARQLLADHKSDTTNLNQEFNVVKGSAMSTTH